MVRVSYFARALRLGLNVLLIDADILVFKDPYRWGWGRESWDPGVGVQPIPRRITVCCLLFIDACSQGPVQVGLRSSGSGLFRVLLCPCAAVGLQGTAH